METSSLTQSFAAGTLAGTGSFECERCGFAVALHELDEVPLCPHCRSGRFKRSSIFSASFDADTETFGGPGLEPADWVDDIRESLLEPGAYLTWRTSERTHVVPLQEGWTKLGRGLSAHLRFDDPTVSRRHALFHREGDEVRVLDDRSLNGVFVNGEHVEWHGLEDGDQVVVGRFSLHFVNLEASGADAATPAGRTPAFS